MEHGRVTKPPASLPIGARNSSPPERRPVRSDRVVPDEFVFHLHRGVELLEEGRSLEAKEALELALSERPKDPESQALLALVYFRLGLYPRAIEIYRLLADSHPDTLSLKVNLAVCYLKTGQHALAEEALIAVVGTDPSHTRAWAYLALAHERLGEHAKAARAYELGGHPRQAERARALAEGRPDPLEASRVRDVASAFFDELAEERVEFRLAAPSQQMRRGTWTTHEPGRPQEESAISDAMVTPADYAPPSLRPTRPPFAPRPSRPPPAPEAARGLPSFEPEASGGEQEPPLGAEPLPTGAPRMLGSTSPAALAMLPAPRPPERPAPRPGLCVLEIRRTQAALLVRSESLFGFEGSLQQSLVTRELPSPIPQRAAAPEAGSVIESWCRFQGDGRLVVAARGRKLAYRLIAEGDGSAGFVVRHESLLAHGEAGASAEGELRWPDLGRLRTLRLRGDAIVLVEVTEGLVEMPLRGRELMLRREVFVACDGSVELQAHQESALGQRGLIRASGHGRLFLLRS